MIKTPLTHASVITELALEGPCVAEHLSFQGRFLLLLLSFIRTFQYLFLSLNSVLGVVQVNKHEIGMEIFIANYLISLHILLFIMPAFIDKQSLRLSS